MNSPLAKVLLISLSSMILAGCQQSEPANPKPVSNLTPVPESAQMNQLASLIAASRYLKQQCNRGDLPDDATINQTVLTLAKQKGWNISNTPALAQLSHTLYQGLLEDATPKETQCMEFNRSLVPFIDAMRSQRNG
ncbi:type II secretion system pilot lipoprotein GspS [Brenneria goodwinii]|nr:type II secretion system pilot lipoprotein GspS [Brenneria goodwinii]